MKTLNVLQLLATAIIAFSIGYILGHRKDYIVDQPFLEYQALVKSPQPVAISSPGYTSMHIGELERIQLGTFEISDSDTGEVKFPYFPEPPRCIANSNDPTIGGFSLTVRNNSIFISLPRKVTATFNYHCVGLREKSSVR